MRIIQIAGKLVDDLQESSPHRAPAAPADFDPLHEQCVWVRMDDGDWVEGQSFKVRGKSDEIGVSTGRGKVIVPRSRVRLNPAMQKRLNDLQERRMDRDADQLNMSFFGYQAETEPGPVV